jgi:hypothetical protein
MQAVFSLRKTIRTIVWAAVVTLGVQALAAAQGTTAITYQGNLTASGFAANGTYDFRFTLYPVAAAGSPVVSPVEKNDVSVGNGVFTTEVDFGSAPFAAGAERWLEVSVREGSSTGDYTALTPRQHVTPTPYALSALSLSGVLPVANGGTGSSVQNFVDLASSEAITGAKTFSHSNGVTVNGRVNSSSSVVELYALGQRLQRLESPAAHGGTGWYSPNLVGGFSGNSVSAGIVGATISGGGRDGALNSVDGLFGTVSGGAANTASGENASVGGGLQNVASHYAAVVGGGVLNAAAGYASTTAGGHENSAAGQYATVGGGYSNSGGTFSSTIGGGWDNTAGTYGTVGGGQGNQASGSWSTVPGGFGNVASGTASFAAGQSANASHSGSFVWADNSAGALASNNVNQLTMRAANGYRLYTNSAATAGVQLAASGGSWLSVSDRNLKHEFRKIDPRTVLRKLAAMDISEWSYKSQAPSIRHIGPVAQDFHAAFGLGEDQRYIGTIDADGVMMSAIQGLYRVLEDTRAQTDAAIATLVKRNEELEKRLVQMERLIK